MVTVFVLRFYKPNIGFRSQISKDVMVIEIMKEQEEGIYVSLIVQLLTGRRRAWKEDRTSDGSSVWSERWRRERVLNGVLITWTRGRSMVVVLVGYQVTGY